METFSTFELILNDIWYEKLIYLMALSLSTTLFAQVQTPQPSPSSKIHQTVGLTEVSIEFSRPSMRGRAIMGELVPLEKFGEQEPIRIRSLHSVML